MANKELYIGTATPKSNEVVWIRPLKSGGVALYAYVYNKWQVLKLVNGKGTLPVDDDEVIDPATPGGNYYTKDEIDGKIADILGIDADQIDELIKIVTDNDTITGLLTELKNKANVTKGNVFNLEDSTDKNEFKVGGYGLVVSPYNSSVSSDRLQIYHDHLSFSRYGLNPVRIYTQPDSDRLYISNNRTSTAPEYLHPIAYLEDIPQSSSVDTIVKTLHCDHLSINFSYDGTYYYGKTVNEYTESGQQDIQISYKNSYYQHQNHGSNISLYTGSPITICGNTYQNQLILYQNGAGSTSATNITNTWSIKIDFSGVVSINALIDATGDCVGTAKLTYVDGKNSTQTIDINNDSVTQFYISQPQTVSISIKTIGSDSNARGKIKIGEINVSQSPYVTALQFAQIQPIAWSGSYLDLSNTPTNVSQFTNDAGYATSSQLNTAIDTVTNEILDISDATMTYSNIYSWDGYNDGLNNVDNDGFTIGYSGKHYTTQNATTIDRRHSAGYTCVYKKSVSSSSAYLKVTAKKNGVLRIYHNGTVPTTSVSQGGTAMQIPYDSQNVMMFDILADTTLYMYSKTQYYDEAPWFYIISLSCNEAKLYAGDNIDITDKYVSCTLENQQPVQSGEQLSLVTTGDKYNWNSIYNQFNKFAEIDLNNEQNRTLAEDTTFGTGFTVTAKSGCELNNGKIIVPQNSGISLMQFTMNIPFSGILQIKVTNSYLSSESGDVFEVTNNGSIIASITTDGTSATAKRITSFEAEVSAGTLTFGFTAVQQHVAGSNVTFSGMQLSKQVTLDSILSRIEALEQQINQ